MIRAEAAIVRAAVANLGPARQWDGARFVVFAERDVSRRVAINQSLKRTTLPAVLSHINFVVAQNDLRVDDFTANGADAASQFVEDEIGVFLLRASHRLRDFLTAHAGLFSL